MNIQVGSLLTYYVGMHSSFCGIWSFNKFLVAKDNFGGKSCNRFRSLEI